MSEARPLVRPSGVVRDLQEDVDILIAKHLEPSTTVDSVHRDMGIGTTFTEGKKITIGTATTNVEIPGVLTVYDIEVGGVSGSLTLGDGDGDVITLGGAFVSAVDTVNLGTVDPSGNTILKLRVELTGDPDAGIRLDRATNTNAYLIAPSTADNPAGTPQIGMIRVTDSGSLEWYNGSFWDDTRDTDRRPEVLDYVDNTAAPPTEVVGDRYILDFTVGGVHADWDGAFPGDIVEFDGVVWQHQTPLEGWITYVVAEAQDRIFIYGPPSVWEAHPPELVIMVPGFGDVSTVRLDSGCTADGNYSFSVGQNNSVDSASVGTAVFGQDNSIISTSGGFVSGVNLVANEASYGALFGDSHSVIGASTHNLISGSGNSVQTGVVVSLVFGTSNVVQNMVQNSLVGGSSNTVEQGVLYCACLGSRHLLRGDATGDFVAGYDNEVIDADFCAVVGAWNAVGPRSGQGCNYAFVAGQSNTVEGCDASAIFGYNNYYKGGESSLIGGRDLLLHPSVTTESTADLSVVWTASSQVGGIDGSIAIGHGHDLFDLTYSGVFGSANIAEAGEGIYIFGYNNSVTGSNSRNIIFGDSNVVGPGGGASSTFMAGSRHIAEAGAVYNSMFGTDHSAVGGSNYGFYAGVDNKVAQGGSYNAMFGSNHRVSNGGTFSGIFGNRNATLPWNRGTTISITKGSGNVMHLNDSTGGGYFSTSWVGKTFTLAGALNGPNNGSWTITAATSTQLTFDIPAGAGVAESSNVSLTWMLNAGGSSYAIIAGQGNLAVAAHKSAVFGGEHFIYSGGEYSLVSGQGHRMDGTLGSAGNQAGNYSLIAGTSHYVTGQNQYLAIFGSSNQFLARGNDYNLLMTSGLIFMGEDSSYNIIIGHGHATFTDGQVGNAVFGANHQLNSGGESYNLISGSGNQVYSTDCAQVGGFGNIINSSEKLLAVGRNITAANAGFCAVFGDVVNVGHSFGLTTGHYAQNPYYATQVNSGGKPGVLPQDGYSQNLDMIPHSGRTFTTALTEIFMDGYGGSQRFTLQDESAYWLVMRVLAKCLFGARTEGGTKCWEFSILVNKSYGTAAITSQHKSVMHQTNFGNEREWDVVISTNSGNLVVSVQGSTSSTEHIQWQVHSQGPQTCLATP